MLLHWDLIVHSIVQFRFIQTEFLDSTIHIKTVLKMTYRYSIVLINVTNAMKPPNYCTFCRSLGKEWKPYRWGRAKGTTLTPPS